MHRRDIRRSRLIHMLQKGHAFPLPFACSRCGLDLPGAGVKPSRQMQRPLAGILVLDPHRPARLCRPGGRCAGSGRQPRLLIDAHHHCPDAQRAWVEGNNLSALGRACRFPCNGRRQPHMMPPRFQLVVCENPLDGLGRNRLHPPVVHHLPGQCSTLPLRPGPSHHIGALTGDLDAIQRHRRGKKRAGGPVVFCPTALRGHRRHSAVPTCAPAVRVAPPVWPWPQTSPQRPTATWPAPVWRGPQGFSGAGAILPKWRGWGHLSQYGLLRGVPAWLAPPESRTGVMTKPQPHCQFFRPFSMGTCT